MTRRPSLSIDQVEKLEKSNTLFVEDEADQPKVDKRKEPKEFEIKHVGGLYTIKLTAGGELPDILKGMWTTSTKAADAIASYIEQRNAKAAG